MGFQGLKKMHPFYNSTWEKNGYFPLYKHFSSKTKIKI